MLDWAKVGCRQLCDESKLLEVELEGEMWKVVSSPPGKKSEEGVVPASQNIW